MAKNQFLFILALALSICGCATNVKFDLSETDAKGGGSIIIHDKRASLLEKTKYETATFFIGESNIKPSSLELVSTKFNKLLTPEIQSKIKIVELNEFQLIIYDPQHTALLAGAAMAGASYSAGIMTENSLTKKGAVDGVISKLTMTIDSRTFSCESFVPAYKEIGAFVGPMVSGAELQKPLNDAIENCVSDLLSPLKVARTENELNKALELKKTYGDANLIINSETVKLCGTKIKPENFDAIHKEANKLMKLHREAEAINCLITLSNSGMGSAIDLKDINTIIATAYELGNGVPIDLALSKTYYKKAGLLP